MLTGSSSNHVRKFFASAQEVAHKINYGDIENMAQSLISLRERGGRLFLLGVGGSAANCSHAVNDFRKLCNIECYAPTDNVSELTARTNDEGWESVFSEWLITSRCSDKDGIFVMSVGGGNLERGISVNLVRALQLAVTRKITIFGIVGRDGGFTKQIGQHVVVIPTVDPELVTPFTEAFHAVVWHCLVSHPQLQQRATKW